jgi:Zn-dependent protease with chaperone function
VSDTVLEGLLFDGRTAAATPVRVTVTGGGLRVTTPAGEPLHEVRLDQLVITEPFASAPRQVTFAGGAVVEVTDGAALTAALAAAGLRASLVERLQQRWLAAAASLVASVALLVGGYLYGLPAAVRVVAAVLPASAERRLGEGVLEVLEGRLFRPTALSEAEQSDAERRIAEAARLGAPGLQYRLVFRSTEQKPGVNAFALPGGTVVILDELVRRTAGDDRLLAVVGHELGHVARHHSTQSLLRAAGVGAFTSLLWGDFSGQAASIPAVFAMLDYSRGAEREADEDAVRFLHATGRSAKPVFDALCLLASVEREAGTKGLPNIFSSHPTIEERLARVREMGQPREMGHSCPEGGAFLPADPIQQESR